MADQEAGADAPEETPDGAQEPSGDGEPSAEELAERLRAESERKADAIQSRNKLKERAKELEAKVAQYEQAERERQRKTAKEKDDFKAIEKSLREETDLWKRKFEEMTEQIAERDRRDRRSQLLDRIASKSQVERGDVDVLLLGLERDGFDSAPEDDLDHAAETAIAKLKASHPKFFAPRKTGGSPSTPGPNGQSKPTPDGMPTDDEYRAALALHMGHRKQE